MRAVPLVAGVSLMARSHFHVETTGVLIGLVCGALTSGLGYALWYSAVKNMTVTRAAVVQLPVPLLAGAGGVLFLGEVISRRFVLSAIVVLCGTLLTLVTRRRHGSHS